jgi:hypothetical protein
MRTKVAVQTLAHTAVAVDHIAQWAAYLIAHRAAEAAANGQAKFIGHFGSLEANNL